MQLQFTKTQLQCKEFLRLTKEQKALAIAKLESGVLKANIKAVGNIPTQTLEVLRCYLSNASTVRTFKAFINSDNSAISDERLKEKACKCISANANHANAPLNKAMSHLYKTYLYKDTEAFNSACCEVFGFEYDYKKHYQALFGVVKGSARLTISAHSLAMFKYNLLSMVYAIAKKSGYVVDGKKLDSIIDGDYKEIIYSIMHFSIEESYKSTTIYTIANQYDLYDGSNELDYQDLSSKVAKLYEKGYVMILDNNQACEWEAFVESFIAMYGTKEEFEALMNSKKDNA